MLKIKENIEKIRFQIIIGNIFNIEIYLNEIIQNINNHKWFFNNNEINYIKDIKKYLQIFNKDKKNILAINWPSQPIKIKNISTILKKNINHNKNQYNNYLKDYLVPKYRTKLINDEKIIRKLNLFEKTLLNAESHLRLLIVLPS